MRPTSLSIMKDAAPGGKGELVRFHTHLDRGGDIVTFAVGASGADRCSVEMGLWKE